MIDENGKAVGVLAHILKTHVTESNSTDMVSALNKDFYDTKIDDQLSNEDLLSYSEPSVDTNKQNLISDAIDTASNKEKFKASSNVIDKEGQIDISSRTNTSNTGLMD